MLRFLPIRFFQIAVRGGAGEVNSPLYWGVLEIFSRGKGWIFLPGGGNLSDVDDPNLFQSQKQLSVNTEHKIKISMTCVSRQYEIKTKMVQEQ